MKNMYIQFLKKEDMMEQSFAEIMSEAEKAAHLSNSTVFLIVTCVFLALAIFLLAFIFKSDKTLTVKNVVILKVLCVVSITGIIASVIAGDLWMKSYDSTIRETVAHEIEERYHVLDAAANHDSMLQWSEAVTGERLEEATAKVRLENHELHTYTVIFENDEFILRSTGEAPDPDDLLRE